jgi:hypothetical protein
MLGMMEIAALYAKVQASWCLRSVQAFFMNLVLQSSHFSSAAAKKNALSLLLYVCLYERGREGERYIDRESKRERERVARTKERMRKKANCIPCDNSFDVPCWKIFQKE